MGLDDRTLWIRADNREAIEVSVMDSLVKVNGADPAFGPLSAAMVDAIHAEAGHRSPAPDLAGIEGLLPNLRYTVSTWRESQFSEAMVSAVGEFLWSDDWEERLQIALPDLVRSLDEGNYRDLLDRGLIGRMVGALQSTEVWKRPGLSPAERRDFRRDVASLATTLIRAINHYQHGSGSASEIASDLRSSFGRLIARMPASSSKEELSQFTTLNTANEPDGGDKTGTIAIENANLVAEGGVSMFKGVYDGGEGDSNFSLSFKTADGTAKGVTPQDDLTELCETDYQHVDASRGFDGGEGKQGFTIGVQTIPDQRYDIAPVEDFQLLLTGIETTDGGEGSGAPTITNGTATGKIQDVDAKPTAHILSNLLPFPVVPVVPENYDELWQQREALNDPALVEEFKELYTISVFVSGRSEQPILIHWTTQNDGAAEHAATEGKDYGQASGTFTIECHDLETKKIYVGQDIPILDDEIDEFDESFLVVITAGSNNVEVVADADRVRVIIVDEDPLPILTITDIEVEEGKPAVFTITMDCESEKPVSVLAQTFDGTAFGQRDGVEFPDYVPLPAEGKRFTLSDSESIEVDTIDDEVVEIDQVFTLRISAPENAVLHDEFGSAVFLTAIGTIIDNDELVVNLHTVNFIGNYKMKRDSSVPNDIDSSIDWSAGDADHEPFANPLAFKRGNAMLATVTFVTEQRLELGFENLGLTSSSADWFGNAEPATMWITTTDIGLTYVAATITSDNPLPDVTKYYPAFRVDYTIHRKLRSASDDYDQTVSGGTSENDLYALWNDPQTTNLYESVVHIGTLAIEKIEIVASGDTDNPLNHLLAFLLIHDEFADRAVRRKDGVLLTYYKTSYNPICGDTGSLLSHPSGDGGCGAFARLGKDILQAQGIGSSQLVKVVPIFPDWFLDPALNDDKSFGFLVKKWAFNDLDGDGKYTNTGLNRFIPVPVVGGVHATHYEFDVGAEVTDLPGLPGQGNSENPASMFDNHGIVEWRASKNAAPIYFDPSYGRLYLSPEDMENQVIAGYFGSKKFLLFDKRTFNFVKVGTAEFRLEFEVIG